MCLDNSWICCCFKKVNSVPHPIPKDKIKGILKTGLTKAKSTSDILLSLATKYAPSFQEIISNQAPNLQSILQNSQGQARQFMPLRQILMMTWLSFKKTKSRWSMNSGSR
jgi:hypothetical protein